LTPGLGPIATVWLDDVRARVDEGKTLSPREATGLLGFVDVLLEQLVMDEKRRAAVVHAIEGEPITWTCQACGDRRPDALISVAHRKVNMELTGLRQVVQINARYCNDRPECLRRIPDDLDQAAAPLEKERRASAAMTVSGYYPENLDRAPMRVRHQFLHPVDAPFKARCVLCGGLVPVRRNDKMELTRRDRCVLCGQLYIYLDDTIGGEPLEASEGAKT
jgi:hypothetical protein